MRPRPSAIARLLLALLVFAAVTTGTALAANRPAGGTAAPQQHQPHHRPRPEPSPKATELAEHGQLTEPATVGASTLARELESSGQVDPVAGLGIRNPVCDELGQIRDRATRLSCQANGSPESDYPTSNYGFDVFISTGVTHPIGDFTAAFVSVLNGIWLGLIFVLKLILELLGIAFSLNPFAAGPTMNRITSAVGRVYSEITDPWLTTLVICAGVWLAYRGLIRRDVAGGVAGTVVAIAMLVVGLWVVHQPGESVGRLASLSNEVALGTISAPQSGSAGRPVGTYAETMSQTWSQLVEVPFAGLDFSDVNWALLRPPPEAVKLADESFCDDIGALAVIALYAHYGSEEAKRQCAAFARKRYGRPRRIIDLYLRSSPGSRAREALWNYFNGNDEYKSNVAAQGGDGALTRLSMLALFAIGLLGAILLLAWLAIRLFTQAAVAFVLLLAAPFALFLPLLGDSGRRAFKSWGLGLLGSLLAKVIYAALLSIALLGISILGRVDGSSGSATGFLLSAAFTWAIFLKRADLISRLSVGEAERHGALPLALPAGLALGFARRAGRSGGAGITGTARRALDAHRSRRSAGAEATRRTAGEALLGSARALADHRYREAEQTVAARGGHGRRPLQQNDAEPAAAPAPARARTDARASAAKPPASAEPTPREAPTQKVEDSPVGPSDTDYRQARQLLRSADRNHAHTGNRWTQRDLQRFAAEDRRLLQTSHDPADHAHRAGYERSDFESLRGPARRQAELQIEKARKRDLQRLGLLEEPSGGAADRARTAAERLRQDLDGSAPERREHLRRLRREARSERLRPRRNLSRGA